jgi:hypothetical protein
MPSMCRSIIPCTCQDVRRPCLPRCAVPPSAWRRVVRSVSMRARVTRSRSACPSRRVVRGLAIGAKVMAGGSCGDCSANCSRCRAASAMSSGTSSRSVRKLRMASLSNSLARRRSVCGRAADNSGAASRRSRACSSSLSHSRRHASTASFSRLVRRSSTFLKQSASILRASFTWASARAISVPCDTRRSRAASYWSFSAFLTASAAAISVSNAAISLSISPSR